MPTYRNDGTVTVSVEDVNGQTVYVEPSKSVLTYKILSQPFTKTSDTPFFPIVKLSENFGSPGTKTGLLNFKVLRLTAEGDIFVKANHADNPSALSLIDGTAMDIENNGEIESLVFTGSGTVKIEGF